jgi:hypothetical protein
MPVHTKKFLLNCVIVVAELSSQTHTSHTETIQKNEDKNIASGRGIENNELLNSIIIDLIFSLSSTCSLDFGVFYDLFWKIKKQKKIAVSCPDIMFNIDRTKVEDEKFVAFANKHDIKKIVEPNNQVRWYVEFNYPFSRSAYPPFWRYCLSQVLKCTYLKKVSISPELKFSSYLEQDFHLAY